LISNTRMAGAEDGQGTKRPSVAAKPRRTKRVKSLVLTAAGKWEEEEESVECTDEEDGIQTDRDATRWGTVTTIQNELGVVRAGASSVEALASTNDDSDSEGEHGSWAWARAARAAQTQQAVQEAAGPPATIGNNPSSMVGVAPGVAPAQPLAPGLVTAQPLPGPAHTVVLHPMFDLKQLDMSKTPNFFEDLRMDIHQECSKFGELLQTWVNEQSVAGDVWVRFAEAIPATSCYLALNGRWFSGRQISAELAADDAWTAALGGSLTIT